MTQGGRLSSASLSDQRGPFSTPWGFCRGPQLLFPPLLQGAVWDEHMPGALPCWWQFGAAGDVLGWLLNDDSPSRVLLGQNRNYFTFHCFSDKTLPAPPAP